MARRSRSSDQALGVLVLIVAGVGAAVAVLVAIVRGLVLLFSAWETWAFLGFVALACSAWWVALRVWRERVRKTYFDAIAALALRRPEAFAFLSQIESRPEADPLLLGAAASASQGDWEGALRRIHAARRFPATLGRISGPMTLAFPGLPSPVQIEPVRGKHAAAAGQQVLASLGASLEFAASRIARGSAVDRAPPPAAASPAARPVEVAVSSAGQKARGGELADLASYERAIAKLEAARGMAGRRAAVRVGLATIESAELRRQLGLEASRLEVEAVLEKADGLKTPAAKLRHLRAALEELRADDVPDVLQAPEIAEIEAAIAEVEGGRA